MNLIPNANELWTGIGGTFDSFNQVIFEFVDNTIANLTANRLNSNNIIITIDENNDGSITYTQEDTGTGIKDIEKSLTIGNKDNRESTLNEHGFGMKHALASANPKNDNWEIVTRTIEDLKEGRYKKIQAPYNYNLNFDSIDCNEKEWPGQYLSTGTIIKFKCSRIFFETVQNGISGKAGLRKCLDYFCEDLGYYYSDIIKEGKVSIIVKSNNIEKNSPYYKTIGAIEPKVSGYYTPAQGEKEYNLGGGNVLIKYKFLEIKEGNFSKYYLKNQSTAGAVKENELVEELRKIKEIHLPDSIKVIKKEFNVFNSIGANTKADLYIFDGQNVILYEAKKDEAYVLGWVCR